MYERSQVRVAFACLYTSYPPTCGAARVTYDCARLTPAEALLVQLSEADTLEQVGDTTIVGVGSNTSGRFRKLLAMPWVIFRICKHLREFRPQYIVLEGASWAAYLALLALALRVFVSGARVVYHAHNIEYILRTGRENGLVLSVTRLAERYLFLRSDLSFAVSREDCRHVESLYGVTPGLLPNGVDCRSFLAPQEKAHGVGARLDFIGDAAVFMGMYAYPPNRDAIHFLVDEVFPGIAQVRPAAKLIITGGDVPLSYPWLIAPGVLSSDDLKCVLNRCRIGIAPVFSGSGTRLKILEYMAAGLPVVTTKKGAEGLGVVSGKHVLYAGTAFEFQQAILRLFDDRTLADRLAREGAAFVQSHYDWNALLNKFALQLREI